MPRYLLIETRDTVELQDPATSWQLAMSLAEAGEIVSVLLAENGVLAARAGSRDPRLAAVIGRGITVFADELALRERAISPEHMSLGIQRVSLDLVIRELAMGSRVLWH